MLSDAVTRTDLAIYLGIYASVVSTAAGLWALFAGVFRDRARITVRANEAYLVSTPYGQMIVRGEDTLATMGVAKTQRTELLELVVRNRGRRPARIENVSKVRGLGVGRLVFGELARAVPFDLPAETSHTLTIGTAGDYSRGEHGRYGFYVVDGAGRVHPLRHRYAFRIAFVVYGWAVRLYFARKRRGLRRRGP
jgi:hypothetical protein